MNRRAGPGVRAAGPAGIGSAGGPPSRQETPIIDSAAAKTEQLFSGSWLSIARFRCPIGDERWSHENWIGDEPHVVFPHVAVAIRQRGRTPVVVDPTQVVLYRAGEHYGRAPISPEGDQSTFLAVGPGLGLPASVEIPSRSVTVDASDVLRERLLVSLCRRRDVDPLVIEEESIRLIARILRGARDGKPGAARRSATATSHAQIVTDAQRYLASTATKRRSLAEVGAAVGASPFHLARVFRAHTGLSLHGYRDQLRLRSALDHLADAGDDLAALAVDLGFASHSHFDTRFRSAFGQSPSAIRTLLRLGGAQTRTMMEALRAFPA